MGYWSTESVVVFALRITHNPFASTRNSFPNICAALDNGIHVFDISSQN